MTPTLAQQLWFLTGIKLKFYPQVLYHSDLLVVSFLKCCQFGPGYQSNNKHIMFFQDPYQLDFSIMYMFLFFISTIWITGGQININIFSPRLTYHHENKSTTSGNNANISSEESRAIE